MSIGAEGEPGIEQIPDGSGRDAETDEERAALIEFAFIALEIVIEKAEPWDNPEAVRLCHLIDATGVANTDELFSRLSKAGDLLQSMSADHRDVAETPANISAQDGELQPPAGDTYAI